MNDKEMKRRRDQEWKRSLENERVAWNKLVRFKVAEAGVDKLPSGKVERFWNFTEEFVDFAIDYREKNPILDFITKYALEDEEVTERAKRVYANLLIEDYLEDYLKNKKLKEEFNAIRFDTSRSTMFDTTARDMEGILAHHKLLDEYDEVRTT